MSSSTHRRAKKLSDGSRDVANFAATLTHGPSDLRGLRRLLRTWLELTDAEPPVRDAVVLATHEATANAMVHGEPGSPVSVSASQNESGGFTIEVTNLGGWTEPGPDHHGYGVSLMNDLMSEVQFESETRVRMLSG